MDSDSRLAAQLQKSSQFTALRIVNVDELLLIKHDAGVRTGTKTFKVQIPEPKKHPL